jgi:DNA-binding transcriptional ArsR family regulator
MTVKVADVRANTNENIRHAVNIIGRSKARRAIFEEIYRGKKKDKTVDDLRAATGLSQVRVLQEGGTLAGNGIVEKVRVGGRIAYRKDDFYSQHKRKVLDLADHPEKQSRYPTKQEPRVSGTTATYEIRVGRTQILPTEITVDDIEAFANVRKVAAAVSQKLSDIPETHVKEFLKRVIGETYEFKDWGGEKNDLFTNKLRFRGRRRTAAFAIKGRATKGPLTPKKMGTNGDQLGRLATSEAQVLVVAYHSKVDQSIHEQLRAYTIGRALAGNRVYYCVIDGDDLGRLVAAYPAEFMAAASG